MNDGKIRLLAKGFRRKIENAREAGLYADDATFSGFPHACCGDTSDLLAEFLRSNGVETIYVYGDDAEHQSHAWLVVKDDRIAPPTHTHLDLEGEAAEAFASYTDGDERITSIDNTHYTEQDIENGLIVDITADQFGKAPVYVGPMDDFHREFASPRADDFAGLYDNKRLIDIYEKTMRL
jgi:hypothetical protein